LEVRAPDTIDPRCRLLTSITSGRRGRPAAFIGEHDAPFRKILRRARKTARWSNWLPWPMKATLSDLVATPAKSPCRRKRARRQALPARFWRSPVATAPTPSRFSRGRHAGFDRNNRTLYLK
jgi:hypothetical protein